MPSSIPSSASHAARMLDPEQVERGLGQHRGVEVAVGVDGLLILHEPGGDARPVVGRRGGHDAVEVVGVALRSHHRLAAAPRAADEVVVVGRPRVVVRDDRLGGLRRQVDGAVAEVLLPLGMVEGPGGRAAGRRVPGVGPRRRVAALEGAAPMRVERARLVLDAAHEATPAPHQEPAVPVVGQQQLEVDLGLDDPLHPAVRRDVAGGHVLGRADAHVDKLQRRQIGAGAGEVRGIRGGGRARGRGGEAGRGRAVHEETLDAGHGGSPPPGVRAVFVVFPPPCGLPVSAALPPAPAIGESRGRPAIPSRAPIRRR